MYVKYAFSAFAIVPYAAAGPERALVVPRRIESLVIPTSVGGEGAGLAPRGPRVTRKAAAAARRAGFRPIAIPPKLIDKYLNSLWVWRHLSSLSIGGTAQAAVEGDVASVEKADYPVGGEDHDQDQDRPIGDRRAGVLDRGRDLVRDPGLVGHPLARFDGEEVGEDRAQQRSGDGSQASHHCADEQLYGQRHRERVRADEPGGERKKRAGDPPVKGGDAKGERLVASDVHPRSEEHTSELQSRLHLVCRLL